MIYLASPYSHPAKEIEHNRYVAVRDVAARALKAGYPLYSPIVHCHDLAKTHELPGDALFWKNYNTAFIRIASAVWILTLEGWTESKGVKYERDLAHTLNIPCTLISPDATFVGTEFL